MEIPPDYSGAFVMKKKAIQRNFPSLSQLNRHLLTRFVFGRQGNGDKPGGAIGESAVIDLDNYLITHLQNDFEFLGKTIERNAINGGDGPASLINLDYGIGNENGIDLPCHRYGCLRLAGLRGKRQLEQQRGPRTPGFFLRNLY